MAGRYKSGDRVRFLNDTGGGRVTRIDEKGIIFVNTADGFEIPVTAGELIPDAGFFQDNSGQENNFTDSEQTRQVTKGKDDSAGKTLKNKPDISGIILPGNISFDSDVNVLLGFAGNPEMPVFSGDISCYLINDSEFVLYYMTGTVRQGNSYHLGSGVIEANTKLLVQTFSHTDLSKISAFHLQALFVSDGVYKRRPPLDLLIDISKINFGKESYYRENEYFEQKAIIFGGKEDRKREILIAKDDIAKAESSGSIKKQPPDTLQVDLHIENLTETPGRLSPSEIIDIQLKKFHTSMSEALEKKAKRFVIVHGVGQGTLKMQIRKELQDKYPQFSFQDASFREYGFGATLVHLNIIKKQ